MTDGPGNGDVRAWAFAPARLGPLRLRNRVLRSGCFEGLCPDGAPSDALREHHRRVAAGGVAMTTVAYCAVSADGRSYATEMWMRPEIVPALRRMTDAIHAEGCAASLQIGHCGRFSDPRVIGGRALAPSPVFCLFRLSVPRGMQAADLARVADDFARAATLAREAGFDAVEVHGGHGYLLSQFLSPHTNRRRDDLGGGQAARTRWPAEVVARVRDAAGPDMAVLVKTNVTDGFAGGITADDALFAARAFREAGADAIVTSGGFTSRTPFHMLRGEVPVRRMVRNEPSPVRRMGLALFGRAIVRAYPFTPTFYLAQGTAIARDLDVPTVLVGGVRGLDDIARARAAGFAFVQMGRATLRDPDFPGRMARGEVDESDCDHCNRCVAAMDAGGVHCVTRVEDDR